MSTYFSVFDCQDCGHREFVGFVGERNDCPIYCAACGKRCFLCPPEGKTLLQTSLAHEIVVYLETPASKKRRTKRKNKNATSWLKTGIAVPIEEGLREIRNELFLTYTPVWQSVPCPHCQHVGALSDYRTYLQQCPQCHKKRMSESDL